MARPSLKKERQAQILAAYEACVAVFGLEGATLERVAEEAGLARALIRHNVGNREDLQAALIKRFVEQSTQALEALFAGLPDAGAGPIFVDRLFGPGYGDTTMVLVSAALIGAAERDPAIARKMRKWVNDFLSKIESFLVNTYPTRPEEDVQAVAAGLVALYFNTESLTPLGKLDKLNSASRRAAMMLVAQLEG